LRTAHICSGAGDLQRGAERFCLSLANALYSQGHDTLLVTGRHQTECAPENSVPLAEVPEVTNKWVRKIVLDYVSPRSVAETRRVLDEFQPQIVHVHSLYGLSTALVHTLSRFWPVVITLHDAFFAFADSGIIAPKLSLSNSYAKLPHAYLHRAINRYLIRKSTLVSPSKWLADFFYRGGFTEPVVIPNGISPKGRQTLYKPQVLWVGALTQFKGLPLVIDEVASLTSRLGWQFIVVGDGPCRERLQARYTKVTFVGNCDPTPFYETASLLFTSSVGRENFPTVIIEAMKHGLCVVGPDSGGVSELIEHDLNGFLYNSRVELTTHLTTLLKNTLKLQTMGRKGRELFLDNFQLEHCVQRYLNLYQERLDHFSPSQP
jgi:glycosyltransferase involved in cell wall biosynthesis